MWESSGSVFLIQLTVAERDTVKLLLFHFLYFYQGLSYFDVFSGGGRGVHISLKAQVSCERLIL